MNKTFFPRGGPCVQKIGHDQWRLISPFEYRPDGDPGQAIVVPQGFVSDGASIPWGLYNLLRPEGDLFPAALVHDFAYRPKPIEGKVMIIPLTVQKAQKLRESGIPMGHFIRPGEPITRREADDLLYKVGVDSGAPRWKCRLAWLGVRVGGWLAWKG